MSDDNARYASDEYELAAMDILDGVRRDDLYRSGEAGGVLVSEYLFMCLEAFKQKHGGMDTGTTLQTIHGLPLGTATSYEDDEWDVIDKETWLGAFIDGKLEVFNVDVPGEN